MACAVSAVLCPPVGPVVWKRRVSRLVDLVVNAEERGRDCLGLVALRPDDLEFATFRFVGRPHEATREVAAFLLAHQPNRLIMLHRAEPTTEWVDHKDATTDVGPFTGLRWAVAHNGTIANDQALRSGFNLFPRSRIDSAVLPGVFDTLWPTHGLEVSTRYLSGVAGALQQAIVGSFALACIDRLSLLPSLLLACNYKPLALQVDTRTKMLLATSLPAWLQEKELPGRLFGSPVETLEPYSVVGASWSQAKHHPHLVSVPLPRPETRKALVVASGGLDSTVVAAWAKAQGYDVTLLHVLYQCRAEDREVEAIRAIGERLGATVRLVSTDLFKREVGHSRLTNTADAIVTTGAGEAGAEFAHEWVPARNLVLLSLATAIADAEGYDAILLGNNLEESGAYPDNEQAFIHALNTVMPYAVQADRQVRILMPVGHLMKHEIVHLGLELGAPLDVTWSCYEGGAAHCGVCGPCYMRRVAYAMNHTPDPMAYLTE